MLHPASNRAKFGTPKLKRPTQRRKSKVRPMKITIEVDCTPAEARTYMGLPDVEPLQAEVMAEVQRRVMGALSLTDPQQLLKNWVPWSAQGMETFQSMFRAAGASWTGSTDPEPPKPKSRS